LVNVSIPNPDYFYLDFYAFGYYFDMDYATIRH